jgi:hypothetical protein
MTLLRVLLYLVLMTAVAARERAVAALGSARRQ